MGRLTVRAGVLVRARGCALPLWGGGWVDHGAIGMVVNVTEAIRLDGTILVARVGERGWGNLDKGSTSLVHTFRAEDWERLYD